MDLDLAGRRVLVTGASKGIGLAIVQAYVAEGAEVVGVARRTTPEFEATGADFVAADLGTADGPAAMVAAVLDRNPRLDVLVNNAGGGDAKEAVFGDPFDGGEQQWAHIVDITLYAAVRTIRAALPALTEARGAIVNISSDTARKPWGAPLPYSVAKGALNVFSRGLAEKIADTGVRVNSVSPSNTRTPQIVGPDGYIKALADSMGIDHETFLAGMPRQIGMLKDDMIDPAEIARAVLLLSSPTMPSAIAENWAVDGGSVKVV